MKISASIYSNNKQELKDLIRDLDDHNVDLFHIDCNDNPGVFADIVEIRKYSNKPIDLHLITKNPTEYFSYIAEIQPEFVTFQYEELTEPLVIPENIRSKLGLSITTDTDISVFEPFRGRFDFILFMATTPGKSGGYFEKVNFKKIRQFKKLFPEKSVLVDGGVNGEVSFILRNLGVDSAVSGSYLFKDKKLGVALLNLKSNEVDSLFKVEDFMRQLDEIPVLEESNCTFQQALQSIEEFQLGFTFLTDKQGKLKGMITNADVRKGLLKNLKDFNSTSILDVTNPNPLTVNEKSTVIELLKLVKAQSFPISYLPVVNSDHQLTGAITFVNLIKGEL